MGGRVVLQAVWSAPIITPGLYRDTHEPGSCTQHTAITPCVIVMTYTALAQTGSGKGKGGFDQDSIEMFLQGNNIQYVIFDEVHKVVEDVHSVSADVTHVLMEWVHDGSLKER